MPSGPRCSEWASRGECERNAAFMLASCADACAAAAGRGGASSAGGAELFASAEACELSGAGLAA
eukprot:5401030-Prymnesium_polylepis.1